jgi:hypothetical protein
MHSEYTTNKIRFAVLPPPRPRSSAVSSVFRAENLVIADLLCSSYNSDQLDI